MTSSNNGNPLVDGRLGRVPRGRCELVCPSRTNERGGEGYCVKEGQGEEGERLARGSVQGRCDYTKALDIEVDP